MEEKFDCRPIEELELDIKIIRKLKDIFIYTIGDLQGKTFEALQEIPGFDLYVVGTIQGALLKKTQTSLSREIQEKDKIENLELKPRLIIKLKKAGIWKISELIKISKVELETIRITDREFGLIEGALKQKYGEKYEDEKSAIMKKNPNAISLGHLDIKKRNVKFFREAGIYTIGDFQRKTNRELKELPGIGDGLIEELQKELERRGIGRYKDGENRVDVLEFSTSAPYEAFQEIDVKTLEQLGNMSLQELEAKMKRRPSMEIILREYLKYTLLNPGNRKSKEVSELQVLARISEILSEIRNNQKLQIKELKTIAEEIARECMEK